MDDVETLREFQNMNVVVALHVLVLEVKPLMYAQLRIWESVHFCAILICGRAMDEKRKKKNTQKKSFLSNGHVTIYSRSCDNFFCQSRWTRDHFYPTLITSIQHSNIGTIYMLEAVMTYGHGPLRKIMQ